MKAKTTSKKKEWHAPNSRVGQGDYYGVGIKNPIGKPIEIMGMSQSKTSKVGKPPKSLA